MDGSLGTVSADQKQRTALGIEIIPRSSALAEAEAVRQYVGGGQAEIEVRDPNHELYVISHREDIWPIYRVV